MIIGICGDIGSGKDTVGDLLCDEFGFERASFAEPLKEWAYDLVRHLGVESRHIFGGSPETKQADQAEELTMLYPRVKGVDAPFGGGERRDSVYWTGRSLLEYLGTEVGRGIHGDVWVQRFMVEYDRKRSSVRGFEAPLRTVITDLRFPNEFNAVHALGGQVWRTWLEAEHASVCDTNTKGWVRSCTCGLIRATGHASDEAWRDLPYDRLLHAPKPGVEILHRQAREHAKEVL